MKQTAAKRRLRHKTTRRHIKRQYEGGNPVHFVGAVGEAYHIQHGFFAMLSLATKDKNLNLLAITGLTSAGAVSVVSTAGLAVVGIGILLFAAMAIRESIHSQDKLHHTVTELIRVLRKIQKTMILCMTISTHYKIVINTHDLQDCLLKIYASLDKVLTDDARNLVKAYAQNYEKESADVNAQVDIVVEAGTQIQKSNRVSIFFSNIGKSIAVSYRRWFKSDAKEKELRELMNELTPFLVLLLSQSVLQFMVCQTSMITEDGKMIELKNGNNDVKQSCQYKDFQLSALLDSIMRIRDDLDRDLANRASHIEALTKEVTRITEIVKTNSNYDSFTGLKAKLDKLSTIDGTRDYDNLRAALTDLNTYDEQVFFKECKSQHQTASVGNLRDQSENPGSLTDRSSPSPRITGESSARLLNDDIVVEFDDEVGSNTSTPPSRNLSASSTSSKHNNAIGISPDIIRRG